MKQNAPWLVIIMIAAVALFYIDGGSDSEQGEHGAAGSERLFRVGSAGADYVRLQAGEDVLSLRLVGNRWESEQVAQSRPIPSDKRAFVHDRMSVLIAARIDRVIADATNLTPFRQVDAPEIQLQAYAGKTLQFSLVAGRATPDGFGRYFERQPQGDVVILPAYQYDNMVRLVRGR